MACAAYKSAADNASGPSFAICVWNTSESRLERRRFSRRLQKPPVKCFRPEKTLGLR